MAEIEMIFGQAQHSFLWINPFFCAIGNLLLLHKRLRKDAHATPEGV